MASLSTGVLVNKDFSNFSSVPHKRNGLHRWRRKILADVSDASITLQVGRLMPLAGDTTVIAPTRPDSHMTEMDRSGSVERFAPLEQMTQLHCRRSLQNVYGFHNFSLHRKIIELIKIFDGWGHMSATLTNCKRYGGTSYMQPSAFAIALEYLTSGSTRCDVQVTDALSIVAKACLLGTVSVAIHTTECFPRTTVCSALSLCYRTGLYWCQWAHHVARSYISITM